MKKELIESLNLAGIYHEATGQCLREQDIGLVKKYSVALAAAVAEYSLSAQDEVLTDDAIEKLAHRRCTKYLHVPGDMGIRYQFANHHLRDFVHDVLAAATPSPAVAVAPKRQVFMDEIDAAKAGSEWLESFLSPGSHLCFSVDEGAQAPRAKWCMLFDSLDRVVAGYILTRDAKNWTELTKINPATPSPSLAVREPKPNADCSGEPENCPDNEGNGCACDPMNTGEAKP